MHATDTLLKLPYHVISSGLFSSVSKRYRWLSNFVLHLLLQFIVTMSQRIYKIVSDPWSTSDFYSIANSIFSSLGIFRFWGGFLTGSSQSHSINSSQPLHSSRKGQNDLKYSCECIHVTHTHVGWIPNPMASLKMTIRESDTCTIADSPTHNIIWYDL